MADRQKLARALMGAPYSDDDMMRIAMRPDPVREYMMQQWQDAIGDAGANAGKAALSGGVAFGTGNPILGTLLALGFGGRAVGDLLRSGRYSGAADAFRRTGLPGAPTGPQLPLDDDPMLGVGRFADPRLTGR